MKNICQTWNNTIYADSGRIESVLRHLRGQANLFLIDPEVVSGVSPSHIPLGVVEVNL